MSSENQKTDTNVSGDAPVPYGVVDFGQQLKACREQAGYSAEQVALLTRISIPYIYALEAGKMADLPADVFVRGFIRNVCRAYGVDSVKFIADFERALQPPPVVVEPEATVAAPSVAAPTIKDKDDSGAAVIRSRLSRMQQIALIVGVAVIGVWFWARQQDDQSRVEEMVAETPASATADIPEVTASTPLPDAATETADTTTTTDTAVINAENASAASELAAELVEAENLAIIADVTQPREAPKPAPAEPVEPPVAAAPPVVAVAEAAGDGEQVVEIVVKTPVRVRVKLDKQGVETHELEPRTYTYKFQDHAELLIFNAAAVGVSFNGRPLGSLGSNGRVRRLSFAAAPEKTKANL